VRHVARLEDEVAGPGDANLIPDLDADLAIEHVAVHLLVSVRVHRRGEDTRLDRMLHERESPPALRSVDHEPYAEPIELANLPS
jgi:hypothetical protein